MIAIRPATQSDIPYLYEICLKTADSGKDASQLFSDPYLAGQYYAAPYLFYDCSLCFVVEADSIPSGYIVCAPDTADFNKWMEEKWLPVLRRRYRLPDTQEKSRSETETQLISVIHKDLLAPLPPMFQAGLADYPAHLHIDLLPAVQGGGWGRRLIETLLAALRARSVPGVHLGVSAANTGALAFYQKTGFTVLHEDDGGFILGQKI